jgi:type I restriction enzyme, S subunit
MKGWSKKRLVEITEKIGSGATPRGGNDAYKESGISLFRSLNVHDGFFKEKNLAFIDEDQANKLSNVQVQEGDVLLNITGASIARCCIAPSALLPARVNQHVAIIRPKLNYIDTNFLAYLFISKEYKDALLNTGEKAGATRQALTKIQLQEFEINIPPLSEQKRIVSIVDEAFEAIDIAIDNTKQNLTNARELFDSYLNAIFTQKNDGWEEKKLEDICREITVGHVGSMASKYKESGIPFLRSQNILPFKIKLDNVVFIDEVFHAALKKSQLRPGDLAIVRTGYPGTAAVIPKDLEIVNCSDLVIVKPDDNINPHYLCLFFNSIFGKSLVGSRLVGAAQKHFNITTAKKVLIPFPCLIEQDELVAKMNEVAIETQRLEAIYRQKLSALNELKQSILHKAFTGELTADKADLMTNIDKETIAV